MSTLVLSLGVVCLVVHVTYWGVLAAGFRRAGREPEPPEAPLLPVSVVVAARDEAERLPALLDALARQTHPAYEVIVVDDASTDATPALVRTRQRTYGNLRLVRVEHPATPRKKHALTQGIAAARYDLLAFTDADCTPPPDWLRILARRHAASPAETVCVGYSPFRRAPGLLNRLVRYETFVTGFLTAAAIGLGRPYMAVGRNLSYSRPLFDTLGGFAHSRQAMSGDDDLFVQEVVRQKAATVCAVVDPQTFVPSTPPATWRRWIRQKLRHLSASRFYAPGPQGHLAVFHATGVALWAAPLVAGWAGLGLLAVRLAVQGAVLSRAAATLHERDLLPLQPILDLLYTAYTLFVAPLGILHTPKRWR